MMPALYKFVVKTRKRFSRHFQDEFEVGLERRLSARRMALA
jgi:hypothetical protein